MSFRQRKQIKIEKLCEQMINHCFLTLQLYSDSFQHAPIADKKRPGSPLSVLEVEDPKQCVLAHFMTPLEPLDPLVESPVSRPLVLQRDTAAELVAEIAPSASQSILLTNMEKNGNLIYLKLHVRND